MVFVFRAAGWAPPRVGQGEPHAGERQYKGSIGSPQRKQMRVADANSPAYEQGSNTLYTRGRGPDLKPGLAYVPMRFNLW
jgi:hypothetical protein